MSLNSPLHPDFGKVMAQPNGSSALTNALRNRKDIATLSLLSGDPTVGNFGTTLYGDVEDKLTKKFKQRENEAQRALTKGYYDQLQGQHQERMRHQGSVLTETIRHNKAMEEARVLKNALGGMTMKDFKTDVRKFSEAMTRMGVPELKGDVDRVSGLLGPYYEGGEREGEGIEGVGGGGWKPNRMVGDDAIKLRQGLASVRNKLLKLRSGAAVTDPEMARFAQELVERLDGLSTDRELLLTWPAIVEGVRNVEAGIAAGYDPEVREVFYEQYRELTGEPPAQGSKSSGPQPNVSSQGYEYEILE